MDRRDSGRDLVAAIQRPAEGRWQDGSCQMVDDRRLTAYRRRQTADGERQTANGDSSATQPVTAFGVFVGGMVADLVAADGVFIADAGVDPFGFPAAEEHQCNAGDERAGGGAEPGVLVSEGKPCALQSPADLSAAHDRVDKAVDHVDEQDIRRAAQCHQHEMSLPQDRIDLLVQRFPRSGIRCWA